MKLKELKREQLEREEFYLTYVGFQCSENGWAIGRVEMDDTLIEPMSGTNLDEYASRYFELPQSN